MEFLENWTERSAEAAGDYALYRNSLANGWRNWSWKSAVNFSANPGYK